MLLPTTEIQVPMTLFDGNGIVFNQFHKDSETGNIQLG